MTQSNHSHPFRVQPQHNRNGNSQQFQTQHTNSDIPIFAMECLEGRQKHGGESRVRERTGS